jgi:hypothetical protein
VTDHRYTKKVCDMCGASVLTEDNGPPTGEALRKLEGWRRFSMPYGTSDICPGCLARPVTVGEVLSFLDDQIIPARVRQQRQLPPAVATESPFTAAWEAADRAVLDEVLARGRCEGDPTDAELDALNAAPPETLCKAVCQPAKGPRSECRCRSCGGEKHGKAREPAAPSWTMPQAREEQARLMEEWKAWNAGGIPEPPVYRPPHP